MDQSLLAETILFVDVANLSFAYHAHHFVTLQCGPCGFISRKTHAVSRSPFDEAMILLDDIVEIFAGTMLTSLRQSFFIFDISNGTWKGFVPVDGDDPRC